MECRVASTDAIHPRIMRQGWRCSGRDLVDRHPWGVLRGNRVPDLPAVPAGEATSRVSQQ